VADVIEGGHEKNSHGKLMRERIKIPQHTNSLTSISAEKDIQRPMRVKRKPVILVREASISRKPSKEKLKP
jgi:hypothetical protein